MKATNFEHEKNCNNNRETNNSETDNKWSSSNWWTVSARTYMFTANHECAATMHRRNVTVDTKVR